MAKKLFYIWWLVLVRGLVEAVLVSAVFLPEVQTLRDLTLVVGTVILAGGVLELIMYVRMRGHVFQGIFRLTGLVSTIIGGYLLLAYPVTREMLLVLTGLWMVVRGFAGLWLGLSIVQRPLDRAVPLLAGLGGIVFGAIVMLWLPAEPGPYRTMVVIYGLGSALVHIALALRIRIVRSVSAVS